MPCFARKQKEEEKKKTANGMRLSICYVPAELLSSVSLGGSNKGKRIE
jgi:hypothetical protein